MFDNLIQWQEHLRDSGVTESELNAERFAGEKILNDPSPEVEDRGDKKIFYWATDEEWSDIVKEIYVSARDLAEARALIVAMAHDEALSKRLAILNVIERAPLILDGFVHICWTK